MRFKFKFQAMLIGFCLSACSNSDERERRPAATPEVAAAACKQFTNEGLKLKAKNRAALEAEAGLPANINVTLEPNRHVPAQHDSIIRFEYDGMEVQLRKPGPGGEMFEYVAVTKRKWLNFPYFRPGVSEANVIAALGEPQRRQENRLVYNCGNSEADAPVVFEIDNGAVQRIVFNYYVD